VFHNTCLHHPKRERRKKGANDFAQKFSGTDSLWVRLKLPKRRRLLYSPFAADKAGNDDMITENYPR
jgi:hypothetical protein